MPLAQAAILVLLTAVGAEAEDPRTFLRRLADHQQIQEDREHFPYLTVTTGRKSKLSAAELSQRVEAYLRKTALGANETPRLPASALDGKQIAGLKECSPDYCVVKLNTQRELPKLRLASDRGEALSSLVASRLRRFLSHRELLGYEARESNRSQLEEKLQSEPFLARLYPKSLEYLRTGVWDATKPLDTNRSFFKSEEVILPSDRLQPIYRLSWLWQNEEAGRRIFVELHLYSNHYFDSSVRILEVFPYEKDAKSGVLVTDIVEIDELKKSSFIRSLFSGQMLKGVRRYQETALDQVFG